MNAAKIFPIILPETLPAKLDRKPMIRLSDKRLGGIPPNGRLKLSELRRQKNGLKGIGKNRRNTGVRNYA